MRVNFLKYEQISLKQWNKTISNSANPLTYAYSWLLDAITDNWGALVASDYSIVMPLPFKTKFNQYIFNIPSIIPKLGYFYTKVPDVSKLEVFFKAIPKNTLSYNITLNKFNSFNNPQYSKKISYSSIDLFKSYSEIFVGYSDYIKSILKDNDKKYIIVGLSVNEIISFLNKINFFSDNKKYILIRRIISLTTTKNLSTVISVFSERNELQGVGFFVFSSYTVDLLFVAAIDDDPKITALIIDKFIKNNAGKTLTLNFESNNSSNNNLFLEFSANNYYRINVGFKRFPKIYNLLSRKN